MTFPEYSLNMVSKNVLVTAIHQTKMHEPWITTNQNSSDCQSARCHAKQSE